MQQLIRMARSKNQLLHWLAALVTVCAAPNLWAQTTQANILGFEGTQYWSTSGGTLTSTTVHSQGNSALALTNASYVTLTSAQLSTLVGVSPEFEIDVQLPAGITWGQIQLQATSPTLGFSNTWIGSKSLSNLAANQFHKLQIPVSTTVQDKLKQNYSDLVLKIVLDVPYSSAPIVIDNLRFSGPQCAQSAFNLVVTVEGTFNAQTLEKMQCTFHTVYPQLVARFNTNAPQTVYMEIKTVDPIAYAGGNQMVFQKQWMTNNPQDTDIVVHEAMHLVQAYSFGNVPGWLTEGIADFVRNEYGLSNIGWSLQQYRYGQHYTNGYGVAATFLQWIEANYAGGGNSRVTQLNQLLRTGQYTDNIWVQWTTHDIATLWHLYSVEKGTLYNELPSPLPAQQGIVVYEAINFGGSAYRLNVGNYKPIDLQARGVPGSWFEANNDSGISSVSVPNGYRVTVYTSNDFSGTGVIYTADESFVGALNDNINSIKVELVP